MSIKTSFKKVTQRVLPALALVLGLSGTAFAHVTVTPDEAKPASYLTFTVNVPNEKDIPTTSLKLVIPDGVRYVTPTQKPGWQITTEKTAESGGATVKSITWSGGAVNPDLRDEFSFSAKVPSENTELKWKAYQTYSDGTVVSWDKDSEGGHEESGDNSGPFSVTNVATEAVSNVTDTTTSDEAITSDKITIQLAFYVSIVAFGLGVVAIYLGTRK